MRNVNIAAVAALLLWSCGSSSSSSPRQSSAGGQATGSDPVHPGTTSPVAPAPDASTTTSGATDGTAASTAAQAQPPITGDGGPPAAAGGGTPAPANTPEPPSTPAGSPAPASTPGSDSQSPGAAPAPAPTPAPAPLPTPAPPPTVSGIVELTLTGLGDPRTNAGCPAGAVATGAVANCGGGSCNGTQVFCVTVAQIGTTDATPVIDGMLATQNVGNHATGAIFAPPRNDQIGGFYDGLGAIADCGDGNCMGLLPYFAERTPFNQLASGSRYLVGVTVTPYDQHATAPLCAAGFEPLGQVADCGPTGPMNGFGNHCSGLQTICVAYATKP